MSGESTEPEVLIEKRGWLGLLTLNRPRAINALTHNMVRLISDALNRWAADDTIATVAIVGAGERGLCAGGDVVSLYRDVTDGDGLHAAQFWRDEYALNARIARYPKPYVAIQDGIVLGGGIGISAHGSHRIVTERSKLGFPEVTIGYIPDVGATWLLSHAPGALGVQLALSAANVGAADAILAGLSDAFVPSDRIATLLTALESEQPDAAIAVVADDPGTGVLAEQRSWSDHAFAAHSVAEILDRLRATGLAEPSSLADAIQLKSPLALAVALAAVHRAATLPSLEAALVQEYRVSRHSSASHDFVEGIRAQLIDKDRDPKWVPRAHAEVVDADVAAFFEIPTDGDLVLPVAPTSKETS